MVPVVVAMIMRSSTETGMIWSMTLRISPPNSTTMARSLSLSKRGTAREKSSKLLIFSGLIPSSSNCRV